MTWRPYTAEVLAALPVECRTDMHIWRARCPMLNFEIVEWHYPDRVLRQFGGVQGVPRACEALDRIQVLHKQNRRGKPGEDWLTFHFADWQLWNARANSVVTFEESNGNDEVSGDYFRWYRMITRRFISSNRKEGRPTNTYRPRVWDQERMVRMFKQIV